MNFPALCNCQNIPVHMINFCPATLPTHQEMHIFMTMPEMAQKYACSNLAPPSGQSALFVLHNLPLCVSLCRELASSYVKDNTQQVVLSVIVIDERGAKKYQSLI